MLISAKTPSKDTAPPERALQRLAGAVLIQALQDAGSGPRRCREEALEWFSGRTKTGFTFEFCCALLGRVPEDVRERLKQHNFIPKWDPVAEQNNSCGQWSSPYPPYSNAAAVGWRH